MSADQYKDRLRHAKWTWREGATRHQGRFPKDRESGRHDKRGARHDERTEIKKETDDATR